MEKEEFEKKVQEIKAKVGRTSLHISRIPEDTKTRFMLLAQNEFESDWGMAIKWLMDFRDGLLTTPNAQLIAKIDVLAYEISVLSSRVQALENKPAQEKEHRTLSGKRIGGMKNVGTSRA